jgi:hypothetical protein
LQSLRSALLDCRLSRKRQAMYHFQQCAKNASTVTKIVRHQQAICNAEGGTHV